MSFRTFKIVCPARSPTQPTQIGQGNSVHSQNLLKLEYEYGTTISANNGNVTERTITLPGVAHDFVQNWIRQPRSVPPAVVGG
jgi:hypothetical protein